MKIIAINSATVSCSVSIVEDQRILYEQINNDGRTHSINLMWMIDNLFNNCGLTPKDLDGFAIVVGPGTFTGLRVGISLLKGMVYGIDKPVVGVNSLDVLSFPLRKFKKPVVSMIDARRGEVYYSCYGFNNDQYNLKTYYHVASPEKAMLDVPPNAILVGSGVIKYLKLFKKKLKNAIFISEDTYNTIRASSVGFLALKRFYCCDTDQIDTLVPEYIRKSDVQLNSGKS